MITQTEIDAYKATLTAAEQDRLIAEAWPTGHGFSKREGALDIAVETHLSRRRAAEKDLHAQQLDQLSRRVAALGKSYRKIEAAVKAKPAGYPEFDVLIAAIGDALGKSQKESDDRIAALEKRIADLEARPTLKYRGPWRTKTMYSEGSFVTHDGSIWHANQSTDTKPGSDETWTLAAKKGRDAR